MADTMGQRRRVDFFAYRALAEVAASALRAHDIEAWVVADDAGGAGGLAQWADAQGAEVQVLASQWEAAREILDLPINEPQ